ncbi:MAG: cytochrome c [Verrucomicrobia bacterium]|nr:cytochrome c [Verrucomicrobiota bacterium]
MKKIIGILISAIAGAGALAVEPELPDVPEAQAKKIKEFWKKNCVPCHAKDGQGSVLGKKLGVKDFTDEEYKKDFKDKEKLEKKIEKMTKVIKEGVRTGPKIRMKAYGNQLNEEEIKVMIKYIKVLKKEDSK